MTKVIPIAFDDTTPPTWAFEGAHQATELDSLCGYCEIWQICDIRKAKKALNNEFNGYANIVECPRYVPMASNTGD